MQSKVTAIVKTIGRPTLQKAIDSAEREGFPVVVVSDGHPLYDQETGELIVGGADAAIELKKNWGCYGAVAANVGVALTETEYVVFVDDDDELAPGAGDIIRNAISRDSSVDIWVQGLLFNNGMEMCLDKSKGVVMGNVAVPIYKVDVLTKNPFSTEVPPHVQDYADFFHVLLCHTKGFSVDWLGKVTYLVRPELEGTNGRGK
tara:strand:- start:10964 stop:11572 length:609 start_codon:yes stop_codon:yes gene_type:complete